MSLMSRIDFILDFRAVISSNSSAICGAAIDDSDQVGSEVAAVHNDADVFAKNAEFIGLHGRQAATDNYNRTGSEFLCPSDVFSALG